jgi:hypothetical protein
LRAQDRLLLVLDLEDAVERKLGDRVHEPGERIEIGFEVRRNSSIPCAAFQRRIASSASRFPAISSRRRACDAFASRSVRADEGAAC